jgi:hypothetical protein
MWGRGLGKGIEGVGQRIRSGGCRYDNGSRILNDLQWTRLSRRRMISSAPFPSPVSKMSLFPSLPVRRRSSLQTGEGEMGWVRSQIIRRRESLVLFKSFNTLWERER